MTRFEVEEFLSKNSNVVRSPEFDSWQVQDDEVLAIQGTFKEEDITLVNGVCFKNPEYRIHVDDTKIILVLGPKFSAWAKVPRIGMVKFLKDLSKTQFRDVLKSLNEGAKNGSESVS